MSRIRQVARRDEMGQEPVPLATYAHDYPAGHTISTHVHDNDQLVFASRGVMTIRARECTWVVPTHRAVWVPGAIPHSITMSGPVSMRTLYFRAGLVKTLPRTCCVVNISPLLEELILHACSSNLKKMDKAHRRHLLDILKDQLEMVQTVPLRLPDLSDPRLHRIAAALARNPGDRRTLAAMCKSSGASKRTVERLFQEEIGMTFTKWRQQVRLIHSLQLLAEGAKVSHAALEAGYNTPSAFILVFKKALGSTPTSYFKRIKKES